ncbi:MAG: aldehyde dehydrogenase family protein [Acidobacteriota bacterium]
MSQATSPSETSAASQEASNPGSRAPDTAVLDRAVTAVAESKQRWARLGLKERRRLLDRTAREFLAVAPRWAEAGLAAKGLTEGGPAGGEEWLTGPYLVVRNLRLLHDALEDIAEAGKPEIPGPVKTRPDGRVTAGVFPSSLYDRMFYPNVTAEVWMQPGVALTDLPSTQAVAYDDPPPEGRSVLVLGAGNVSSIGPMDALYKLFVEKKTVVVKAHPVNAFLGPLFEEGFASLIAEGFLRIVYGGAEEGDYLCRHPEIDEIHITGSDRTYDAIVFGPGADGQAAKAENRPRNQKTITAELGNVSPVIVVPGPWKDGDFSYQAQNLAAMLVNNAGFNCNATRVIVLPASWPGSDRLLDELRRTLERISTRQAYYPGARDRFAAFQEAHPEMETFGQPAEGELPWALVPDVDPRESDDICFRQEAFCGLFAATRLAGDDLEDYLERATEFCNQALWGSLNATLIVHPAARRKAAVEEAISNLRYGTVAVNHWAAVGYGLVVTTWGAFPGHPAQDIQSGNGVVHNTLMFSRAEKSVVRAPFRAMPKPPWFPGHRTDAELAEALTRFEAAPSPFRLPGIFWEALRG